MPNQFGQTPPRAAAAVRGLPYPGRRLRRIDASRHGGPRAGAGAPGGPS